MTLVSTELIKISKWFKLNKLSLNVKKTNCILFRGKRRAVMNGAVNVTIDGKSVSEVNKTKFLGVVINQTLTWRDHIELVKQKVAKNIGILTRVRYCIPSCVLLSLYHALIEPYLMYCNIVWASQNSTLLHSLFLLQKQAVQIITFSHWSSHTDPIFKRHCLSIVNDINKLQTACFMFNAMHNLLPQSLGSLFKLNSSVHSYFTRHVNDFHLTKFHTNVRKFSISVQGPLLWNSLPTEIKNLPNIGLFKCHYKSYLLQ